jgi:hypothetical protein
LIETAPSARQAVLWKSGEGRGLLIDTPAVPLRFESELPLEDSAWAPAPALSALQSRFDDAQQRIRELEALLFCRDARAAA